MTLVPQHIILQSPASNDPLLDLNTQPSLDLQFATGKTLNDRVSGNNLITFSRADATTCATYVDSNGVIQTAAANVPRFDHDPVTGESLGLLIEESRTNKLARSEEFDNAYYTKAFVTVTPDQSAAPDGNTTADQVLPTTNGSYHRITKSGLSVSAPCVLSVFVKANGYNHFQLRTRGSSNRATVFDVSDGTITQEMEASIGETNLGNGLTPVDYGNGWWRLSMLRTDTDTITAVDLSVLDTGTPGSQVYVFTGDGTSSVFCWGAMLEQGSFPTSYIPTAGTTVTRAPELVSILGADYTSVFGTDLGAGTVFTDVKVLGEKGNTNTGYFSSFSTNDNNSFTTFTAYDNRLTVGITTPNANIDRYKDLTGVRVKSAVSWNDLEQPRDDQDNASHALDGTLYGGFQYRGSGTPLNTEYDRFGIGRAIRAITTFGSINGHISRLAYYPYRLADATLQEITS
jgi:hypothetical protein